MTAAYVYAAIRTPFGKLGGGLAQIRPDDLAATVLTGLLAKTPGLEGRSTRSSGATPMGPGRRTGTSAGWRCCWPVCRLLSRPPR
jgi:acetyl-CoA acetyltransferase